MKTLSLTFFAVYCLASAVFAASPSQGQSSQEATLTVMSFDDVRAACLNPSRFHNQTAPTNIQISCKDLQTKWIPDADGSLKMGCGRHITASLISDKYTTQSISGLVPMAQQVAACPRFKEVTETIEAVRAVSCQELIEFTGNAIEFCAGAINSLKSVNPKAISVQDSGRIVDLCSSKAGQRAQLGQQ
jgi:hypothetical protein